MSQRLPDDIGGGSRSQPDRAGGNAARHLAIAREKHELRRERDRLVVELADSIGPDRLAETFGLSRTGAARMLTGARERLRAAGAEPSLRSSADITVRRVAERQPTRLVPAAARRDPGARPSPEPEGMTRSSRATAAGQLELGQRARMVERARDRWANADDHYEALGRSSGRR
jgi:hypothetical protein